MDERWQQVEKVYHAVCALDKTSRAEFLSKTCAGDDELRHEVESLLAQDDLAGSFLETPAIELEAEALARERPGTRRDETSQLAGSMVSHYRVLEKLGGGGMGVVYKAVDTMLGRHVALKFLPEEFSKDPEKLARFRREAWSASALNHPNICTIYEIGEYAGRPFIAMELIEGKTIAERLKDGPLTIEEATEISRQIAEALQEAHEHNIIHRDLKPLNVMVTTKGRVKILDFGLAKTVQPVEPDAPTQESLLQTQAGALMGTVPYMSPEQLRGGHVDARTDLYALGVVFYEMATGERPFPETQTTQLIAAILTRQPRPPHELNSQIPAQLEAIILKSLAKEPDHRYQSAEQMLADICQQGHASANVTFSSEVALRQKPGRRITVWALFTAIGILILASVFWFVVPAARRHFMGPQPAPQALPVHKRLAVLPFTVVAGSKGDDAFGRGLQETLAVKLTQLSSGRSLQVVPVGALAAQHVETAKDAQKLFGVNLALTGSVERVGHRFRVSYALVDPSSILQLRGETLTLAASDPFAIEDRVVEGTAAMLGLKVPSAERQAIEKHGTRAAPAFLDYLQGLGYLQNYDRPENIDRAIYSFKSALKVDPTYTLAYASLGRAYWLKYTTTEDTGWVDQAQESCSHAVTLDQKLPATHLCLGILENVTGRYAEAIAQFKKVLDAEPTNISADQGLANAQYKLKRTSEAEATYHRAINVRPNYWAPYNWLGVHYWRTGENGRAAEMFRKVIDLAPDNRLGFYNLGGVDIRLGKLNEAEEMLKKSIAIQPSAGAYTNLGVLTYTEGRFDNSVGYFEKAVQLSPKDEMLWGNLADAYKWSSNQRAKAVPAYRKAAALARDGLRVNPSSYDKLGELAIYEAQSSDFKQAMVDLRKALSLAPPKDTQLIYNAALVYHLAGKRARALDYLRRACKAGYSVASIQSDPEWKDLKADPEFQRAIGTHKH